MSQVNIATFVDARPPLPLVGPPNVLADGRYVLPQAPQTP
jgi:hypothetical protein